LCGVTTVEAKLDHRAAHLDARLRGKPYINALVRPERGGWRYDEGDRPAWARHWDWLWRMAVKGGVKPDHRGGVKVDQRRG
jgi:hypothetical protein